MFLFVSWKGMSLSSKQPNWSHMMAAYILLGSHVVATCIATVMLRQKIFWVKLDRVAFRCYVSKFWA